MNGINFTRAARRIWNSLAQDEQAELRAKLIEIARNGDYGSTARPLDDGMFGEATARFVIIHRFDGDILKVLDIWSRKSLYALDWD